MSSFFRELRRRHVLKVGGAYVVAAIGTVGAADLFFPRLALPDWTVTLVVGLAVVGFPVALVLAWAYEVTPTGIEREGRSESTTPGSGRDVDVRSTSPMMSDRSVAVLPFADMSPGQDQEYLADGLAEEILNGLTRLRNLRVAARTSSFAFKGRDEHVRDVGRTLEVAHILEGSVRKWGDRLRVTAQLISVEDGYHVWSEVYDRQLDDIFQIQDEIARAIVEKLEVDLLEEEDGSLVVEHTESAEAFDLYLKGRHAWYNRYRVGLQTALTYFEQAREEDPGLALAHCGVADTYSVLGLYGLMQPWEAETRAFGAAERALELAPDLPEAHFSHALTRLVFGTHGADRPNWDVPMEGFLTAWELRPDYAEAVAWHGIMWASQDDRPREEVLARAERIRSLDPDSVYVADVVGLMLSWAGQDEEALTHFEEALAANPEDTIALWGVGNALLGVDRPLEAVPMFRTAAELTNGASIFLGMLGYALAMSGDESGAREVLDELLERQRTAYVLPGIVAAVAANVGEREMALDLLEEGADGSRHPVLVWLLQFPVWDALHGDPRFQAVVEHLGIALPRPRRGAAR